MKNNVNIILKIRNLKQKVVKLHKVKKIVILNKMKMIHILKNK